MTNPISINLSKLHIRYQHHWLFDQFSFELDAGKWTCLLGPSGIGKTTLLRFIAGLKHDQDTECAGVIGVSDNLVLNGRLSYLTQKDSLFPWLSIYDNLLVGYYLRNEKITTELKSQAMYFLEKVGLTRMASLKPNQLSIGMRRRVALARVLIEDRIVVLMDEPFSALDTINKLKLQDLAADILSDRTVLLVTHDPLEALRLGDKICILDGEPAKIVYTICSDRKTPRDILDERLLSEQAELFKVLKSIN